MAQEIQAQQKREVDNKQESTLPFRAFLPATDIFETDQALIVVLEMPGVEKDNVDVDVEGDVVKIEGRVDFSRYESLQPVYTEYNVGHFVRSFRISNQIDQDGIKAEMENGVMRLILPKAEKAKPRRITIRQITNIR